MSTVVVTDGEQRSALAVVRSLGRAGHRVVVASERRRSLAGASRWAADSVVTPSPLREPERAAEAWGALCRRLDARILVSVTDAGMLAGFAVAEANPGVRIPPGTREGFLRASDKAAVAEAGARVGLPVPEQVGIATPGERPDASALPWPVVMKPARSVVGGPGGRRIKLGVAYARDASELDRALAALPPEGFPVLIQRRVEGTGVGVFQLPGAGGPMVFAHRRLRERPPTGGVSTLRESIAADPPLLARASALLVALGWAGLAMVECKVDREGRPWLMEVNARFWGSLQLAVDAGADFPARLVRQLEGGDPGPPPRYRTGVRSRWWWGDVDHLLARFRHRVDEGWLPPGTPGRWRTLWEVLRPFEAGRRGEVLRLDDPAPFLVETLAWLRREG